MNQITAINPREAEFGVDQLFLDRWSPRAFSDAEVGEQELLTILDAAHWAPSAFNAQPWRFVYARRGDASWERLVGVLNEFNQSWARDAGALVVIVSKTHDVAPGATEATPTYSHSFDAGAAWAQLALQSSLLGLHAHAMTGLNFETCNAALGIPEGYRVEAAVAIGRLGDKAKLPDFLRDRETPSPRLPLSDVAFHGGFAEA